MRADARLGSAVCAEGVVEATRQWPDGYGSARRHGPIPASTGIPGKHDRLSRAHVRVVARHHGPLRRSWMSTPLGHINRRRAAPSVGSSWNPSDGERVVVYGAGGFAREVIRVLTAASADIACALDRRA